MSGRQELSNGQVRKPAQKPDTKLDDPEQLLWMRRGEEETPVEYLRKMRGPGVTQRAVGKKMGLSQPRVAGIEDTEVDRLHIGTLANYINALDGTLHIIVDFSDTKE